MLASAEHRRWNEYVRFAVSLGLQERDDRQFGDVELRFAHQRFERRVGYLHVGEVEVDQVGFHRAFFQCQRVRIIAE
jgi:hypothetical protein